MLKINQELKCEISNENVKVIQKLGEGGQGIVYLVEGMGGKKALKWYNTQQSTTEQKESIIKLIAKGAPKGSAGGRFVWPLDIVTAEDSDNFGYLMNLIDTSKFAELGEVWARLKPAPGMKTRCKISHLLANSYRQLHLEGYCYRDISSGNFMFNPQTGDVLISDNDNVGINNQSESQIQGTMEYMAPELILGKTRPSTRTDLHSLAVLLFQFWVWHHPFHGLQEYNIRSWDIPAKRKVYGEEPVFIFDPQNNKNNLPNDPAYDTPRRFWKLCPGPLKKLFVCAFTEGLCNPDKRVTEGEWQSVFIELHDCIVECPADKAENFWYENINELRCWYCGKLIDIPLRLAIKTPSLCNNIVMTKQTQLLERHINPYADETQRHNVIGQIVQNPDKPDVWGLRNMSQKTWQVEFADGTKKEVPPQKAVPLNPGVKVRFENAEGKFIR